MQGWIQSGYRQTVEKLPERFKTQEGKPIPGFVMMTEDKIKMRFGMVAMRKEAVRQLAIRVEPMITAKQNHVVLWNELDAESKWLMPFILGMEAFPMTYSCTLKGMPNYLSSLETALAYAEMYQDQGRTWLRVKLLSADGKSMVTHTGVISRP